MKPKQKIFHIVNSANVCELSKEMKPTTMKKYEETQCRTLIKAIITVTNKDVNLTYTRNMGLLFISVKYTKTYSSTYGENESYALTFARAEEQGLQWTDESYTELLMYFETKTVLYMHEWRPL